MENTAVSVRPLRTSETIMHRGSATMGCLTKNRKENKGLIHYFPSQNYSISQAATMIC